MEFIFWPVLVFLIIILLAGIKIIDQYQRGVVLTLGTFTGVLNPGLKIVIPIIQRLIRVDLRITTADIPQQEVITKDNVPVGINAVVYFQVVRPEDAVLKIQDYHYAVTQYAQTALRDVIGGVELDMLLTEREKLAEQIKALVDKETDQWGVNVNAIKMQDIELPADMKRVMAKQTEAERERRATIIRAQGELSASKNLQEAMQNMNQSGGIALRTLQTIEATTANPANTVVFALPTEVLAGLKNLLKK
ncbi:slipin family protein [Candidatus Daviesbacteria bacterium]|nr:slipin family protein [Candidatus Daviesbacteria bacterium]